MRFEPLLPRVMLLLGAEEAAALERASRGLQGRVVVAEHFLALVEVEARLEALVKKIGEAVMVQLLTAQRWVSVKQAVGSEASCRLEAVASEASRGYPVTTVH